jgi:hypothetical protein
MVSPFQRPEHNLWTRSRQGMICPFGISATRRSLLVSYEKSSVRLATIGDLGGNDYALTEPIMVLIHEYPDEGMISAKWPEVEAFGEGDTEAKALESLKADIASICDDVLLAPPSELGTGPLRWQKALSGFVEVQEPRIDLEPTPAEALAMAKVQSRMVNMQPLTKQIIIPNDTSGTEFEDWLNEPAIL